MRADIDLAEVLGFESKVGIAARADNLSRTQWHGYAGLVATHTGAAFDDGYLPTSRRRHRRADLPDRDYREQHRSGGCQPIANRAPPRRRQRLHAGPIP